MEIIEVDNLVKEYERVYRDDGFIGSIKALANKTKEKHIAIDNFNMKISKGEFIGLIGPNGAGKTTLIKMLTGIIHPTSGLIRVLSFVPSEGKNTFKKKIAVVMGQKSQLWFDLPASDTFLLNKKLYGISDEDYRIKVSYLSELLDVKQLLQVPVRNLSLGERMKMEFISALLHDPEVIFLDEPTIGLDAISQRQMWDFLKTINVQMKKTIILTSHYMEDIRRLCSRTIVVNNGKKIYDGSFHDLLQKYQTYKTVTLVFDNQINLNLDEPVEWLNKGPYHYVFRIMKESVSQVLQEVFQKYEPMDITIREEDIDAIIQKIYCMES